LVGTSRCVLKRVDLFPLNRIKKYNWYQNRGRRSGVIHPKPATNQGDRPWFRERPSCEPPGENGYRWREPRGEGCATPLGPSREREGNCASSWGDLPVQGETRRGRRRVGDVGWLECRRNQKAACPKAGRGGCWGVKRRDQSPRAPAVSSCLSLTGAAGAMPLIRTRPESGSLSTCLR